MNNIYTKEFWKGSVITSPIPPTLVTCCNKNEKKQIRNVLTIAWTGILNTQPPVTYISIRPERFSYTIIKESGEFVINLATEELVKAVDICGVKSGRNVDKFAICGFKTEKAKVVNAPIICQCPVNIECKVKQIIPLGSHHMFVADIVGINAAKELIDNNGKLCLDRAKLLAYAHGEYFALGKKLGSFGFSVRKKHVKNKKSSYGKGR